MATEQQKTMAALKAAIQMEIDGKQFYLKASQASGNELGRKLLEKLAEEEDVHRSVFEKIYEEIEKAQGWPDEPFQPDGGRGLRTVFARVLDAMDMELQALPTEIEAVQKAAEMESRTYDFYNERVKKAGFEAEKQFYQALAMQEEEHHRVLLDYYEFLKDPAAWFVQKEHPSLDGG